MNLKDFIQQTSSFLSEGRPEVYKNHPLAQSIRGEGKDIVEAYLPGNLTDYKVEGSAGRGQWADIPWVSIYNLSVTDKASKGYYVVYLFPSGSNKIILGLAQSSDEAVKEYGAKEAVHMLNMQGNIMRMKIPEFDKYFLTNNPEIEISGTLDYRNGHVYHLDYDGRNLPSDEQLKLDLENILTAYEALFLRGGRDSDNYSNVEDGSGTISIVESYKIKAHSSIERPSSSKIKKIKAKLGYECMACGFDFEEVYGETGKEYIEAHHLTPIANLKEGESRTTTEIDFAMLCSNCHRMIHRFEDSSDLEKLKELVKGERR
jgi:5-methylcytosine-specific restriction protein A